MDCYGLVREIRNQPGVFFVNVGTCNQNIGDFFNWTFPHDQDLARPNFQEANIVGVAKYGGNSEMLI